MDEEQKVNTTDIEYDSYEVIEYIDDYDEYYTYEDD